MDLKFNINLTQNYTSKTQIARILSEDWMQRNAYCPNCGTIPLQNFENNRPVADFFCKTCAEEFELKSKKGKLGKTVTDGAYHTMIDRIQSENNPNFFFLTYTTQWKVHDFVVIPKQFFTSDIIIQRKPLAQTAKRAGWIGCNIDLSKVSDTGKVYLVKNEQILDSEKVNKAFIRTLFLRETTKENRGWILETLSCMQQIPQTEFTLEQMYRFESQLKAKFPENHHIKPKIRQQLQFLRDNELVEFMGRGKYRKVL